jgi:signal transduction histidine kinase
LEFLKENYSDKLDAKKINLYFEYNLSESFLLKTNPEIMIHQILGNLLSNAIKFSQEKSDICIKLEKSNNKTFIFIKDSGVGIPNNILINLFDIHANTNRLGTTGEVGTGFGLPIVKTYVEKLDGQIFVSSNDSSIDSNRGTIFKLVF